MTTLNSVSGCLFANPLCPKSVFWTNLMLLGFDPSAHVSYSTIVFNKDVFAKGPSSVKAMELIIWFLFNELDSTLTKEKFIDCWPVTTLANSVRFRSVAYKWLEQLKKEGCLGYTDIILRRSAFDECQGERFERVIMAFSNYVVKVSLDREYQNYCQVFPINFKILKESDPDLLKAVLKIHIKIQTDKFITDTQERLACQEHWKNLANFLAERIRDITERNNQLDRKISEFYKGKLILETFDNLSIEKLSSLRSQRLEKARSTWNLCLSWIKNNQNFAGNVEDIIHDRANKYRLDGQELLLEVPEIMMTIWGSFFQKEQINPYQGGKKELKSLLKLWRFSLQSLINHHQTQRLSYSKFKNEDISCTLNKLEEYLLAQQKQTRSLSSLKNLLRARLNETNKSIESLREDHNRSLTFTGHNKETERRNVFVMLKVPYFNFKCDIYANQIEDDKEMVELKLGHEFNNITERKVFVNKFQDIKPRSTDMERGLLPSMTQLSEKHSSAKTQNLRSNMFLKSPAVTTTPYDILTNDIVNHVANDEDSPLTNSPSQYDLDKAHNICDPLNAMKEEMFRPKREIARTPRSSVSTPQIKPALKPETASRGMSTRSVRFADVEALLMDETPPKMVDENEYSTYNEYN